ncbi:acyltransferase [Rhodococcus sp. HNM0563]|uniref:acyltransferase family protein n=1 Tax=Rhodococcus sp. HNM0563 TaxID=2716339 RepID=UPI001469B9EB|nr:acyltransferase [Rhodococcus sp. HNM0563]
MSRPLFDVPARGAEAPRVQLPGLDLLRFLAAIAVVYSHICFYLIDDLGTGWWFIDVTHIVLTQGVGLNMHLSFVGVSAFMMLTGLLITRSAIRQPPGQFLIARAARLVPAFWVCILAAILLVRFGINGMFSGHTTVTGGEAALSFFLGAFFLKPQVAVLGVAWTLAVQIMFYLFCVSGRSLLRTKPIVMPLLGAALCMLVIIYNLYVPEPYTVPFLSKIAATLPTVFLGQIAYLAWARLISVRGLLVALIAQVQVIVLATDMQVYWAGSHYLWTICVVFAVVVLLSRYDGRLGRLRVVHWVSTRSYAIYLVHTLVMYRIYENTVGFVGMTGAVICLIIGVALVSELVYRGVEVPAARWIGSRWLHAKRPAAAERVAARTHA